jgi:alanine dehydrogenase
MIVGVPKEIKDKECRVSLTPGGVESLVHAGHQVLVQTSAGVASGFGDGQYEQSGAQLVDDPERLFGGAEMILKVKEPLPEEHDFMRPGLLLFTYLHLAANKELTQVLVERKVDAIGYETVQRPDGSLTTWKRLRGAGVSSSAACLE